MYTGLHGDGGWDYSSILKSQTVVSEHFKLGKIAFMFTFIPTKPLENYFESLKILVIQIKLMWPLKIKCF